MSDIVYRSIVQSIDMLRNRVEQHRCLLKTNKYLANADWHFIDEHIHLTYSYVNKSIGRHRTKLTAQFDNDERIRLIHMQKVQ
jgi:hypothetical protein